MPQRLIFLMTGVAAVALAIAMGALVLVTRSNEAGPEASAGTDLLSRPAPEFRLTDHNGRPVALSDFRGKPVVLTFLYTNCQDICPVTAFKLRQVYDALGDNAGRVAMLAVSVDPDNDDQAATHAFSERFGLLNVDWHYLSGAESDLAPVWQSYGIGHSAAPPGLGPSTQSVLHTDALFVIDAGGRQRRFLRSDFDPAQLAAELRLLVSEQ